MNGLILDAGFGTRLRKHLHDYVGPESDFVNESIEGKPKGLVPVKLQDSERKPIASHQVGQLLEAGVKLSHIYVQTNDLFYRDYLSWAENVGIPAQNVFNKGVSSNEQRNEQAFDMLAAISKIGTEAPLFLFASDTLVFDRQDRIYDLGLIVDALRKTGNSHLVVYYKAEEAYKHGIVFVGDGPEDEYPLVTNFIENPPGVDSGFVNSSVYLFSVEKIEEILSHSEHWSKGKKGNPLELTWQGFRAVQAARRLDMGTLEDFLKENGVIPK